MISSYKDLQLSTLLKIDAVLESDREEVDKQVAVVAILAGMTEAEVLALPLPDYSALARQAGFLADDCTAAPYNGEPVEIGGTRFIATKDITAITTAQFIDYQSLISQLPSSWAQLLSVFFVPEGHKYNDGYNLAQAQTLFGSVSLPMAKGMLDFFVRGFVSSLLDIARSLERKAAMKMDPITVAKMQEAQESLKEITTAFGPVGVGLRM